MRTALSLANRGNLGNGRRLADALNELGRVSPLYRWFAVRALEPLIASFEKLPNDAAHLLEFYLNGLVELGLSAPTEVRKVLSNVKVSSKAGKASRRIVEIAGEDQSSVRDEAKSLAFQARMDRAMRWQSESKKN